MLHGYWELHYSYLNWRFLWSITNDVEKCFDISNYDENDKRTLLIGKNEKLVCLFKDALGGKIIKEFIGLRAKTNA